MGEMSFLPTRSRGLEAVIFDAGNTLIFADWEAIIEVARAHGRTLTVRELEEAEYAGRASVAHYMAQDPASRDATRGVVYFGAILEKTGIGGEIARKIADGVLEVHQRSGLWRVVPPGLVKSLERLKAAGLTMGVISNADGKVAQYLERAGLSSFFSFVIDSHLVGVEKPDRRIFEMGLEQAGVAAARSLYAGDIYEIDVLGARTAGMEAVLIDPLLKDPNRDVRKVRGVSELADLLLD